MLRVGIVAFLTIYLLFTISAAPGASAQGPPPPLLHFQARLSASDGSPLQGPVTVTISIYNVSAGGAPLWTEMQSPTAQNGVVNLLLGELSPFPASLFDGSPAYVGVKIGADAEMSPRRVVASVPFALRSSTVAAIDANTTIPSELITSQHILDATVASADLADGSVTSAKIAAGAVGAGEIAPGAVTSLALAANSVDISKIGDGAVTAPKLAPDAVDTTKIADGAITTNDLAGGSVTSAILADGGVTAADLAGGSVTNAKIAPGAVSSASLAGGSVDTAAIGDGAVTAPKLAPGSVTTNAILAGAVVSASIAPNAVANIHISAGAVMLDSLATESVNSGKIVDASIATIDVADSAITAPKLAESSVTTVAIAPAAVVNPSIANGAVDGSKIAPGAIDSIHFAAPITGAGVPVPVVEIVATGAAGTAVSGRGSNAGGVSIGVLGQSSSSAGIGVQGSAATLGVRGIATSSAGVSYGVYGAAASQGGYAVYAAGNFGGTGFKYFVQPHPTDPALEIRFVCLEGNESGTYFRGSSKLDNGAARIRVPEEFRLVTEEAGLTVQITPVGARAEIWVETKSLNEIVVRGSGEVHFDYLVNGVRRGFADHKSIQTNRSFVPEVSGAPYGAQYPDAIRKILVDNGILNIDFTPNEQTAAKLGWALHTQASSR